MDRSSLAGRVARGLDSRLSRRIIAPIRAGARWLP